jgi:hypothetical protein
MTRKHRLTRKRSDAPDVSNPDGAAEAHRVGPVTAGVNPHFFGGR